MADVAKGSVMSYSELRPHHGLCFQFYEGKGYSPDFTNHMGKVIKDCNHSPQQVIRLMITADTVCENCPNNDDGICTSHEKVTRYDEEVLRVCGISEGELMPYADFIALVKKKIIDTGLRGHICGDCSWDDICREKEACSH